MGEPMLTKEQVQDVLNFAQGLWAADRYGYGVYSPFMSNQLLNGLNNNARIPTSQSIKEALSNYKEKASDLQDYTAFMTHFDMIFQRTLYSYVNALSMDLSVSCKNAYAPEEYTSGEYVEDKRRFYRFLEKFDYRSEFYKVLVQVMTNEVFYTWFRKTKWGNNANMKCALQILPQQNCMLTGYWENGLLFDL